MLSTASHSPWLEESRAAGAPFGTGVSGHPIVRGIVWDMDGTLTAPVFDFAEMRRRIGLAPGAHILETIAAWDPERQSAARAVIREMEREALVKLRVTEGVLELCADLDRRGIPRAVVTQNAQENLDYFHRHHFPLPPFAPAISRDSGHRVKPHPDALLACCDAWGIPPSEVLMVGDSARDDVPFGRRAGALTVLLDSYGAFAAPQQRDCLRGTESEPHFFATSFAQVRHILDDQVTLLAPGQEAPTAGVPTP